AEKGITTLLDAWKKHQLSVPLKIVGDGPLAPMVVDAAAGSSNIEWLRSQPSDVVYRLIGDAACMVLPSQCYENFPRVAVEAMAKGTPVIASRMGAMAEIIDHGRVGLNFTPGDSADLAKQVRRLVSEPHQMRVASRREYEEKYTAEANFQMMMAIYD